MRFDIKICNVFRRVHLIGIFLLCTSICFACDCECEGNCSFSAVLNNNDLLALIKVKEYGDYLEYEIGGNKMPMSMTVEVITKYKGKEEKKYLKIWGDDGSLCRPYILNFKLNNYYLISPSRIESGENYGDYDFFSCWSDYLFFEEETQMLKGNYSQNVTLLMLDEFEQNLRD